VKELIESSISSKSPKSANMNIQDTYQKAIRYAAEKHAELQQTLPGSIIPYAVHLSNVAMEILIAASHTNSFDTKFAIQVALLHDILEDTQVTVEELTNEFGTNIAMSVLALTKSDFLPKDQQMPDSLSRIKQCEKEVWAVKIADRITNLQPPPSHWDKLKKSNYLLEAKFILNELRGGNEYLENRLDAKIVEYQKFI
jgi:guanosine-3',5'-bis(diphosphate) 3'-pyrophosphohydrolase